MRIERVFVTKRTTRALPRVEIEAKWAVSGLVPIVVVYLVLISVGLWSISLSLDTIMAIMGQVHDLLVFPGTFSPLTGCYTGRS